MNLFSKPPFSSVSLGNEQEFASANLKLVQLNKKVRKKILKNYLISSILVIFEEMRFRSVLVRISSPLVNSVLSKSSSSLVETV